MSSHVISKCPNSPRIFPSVGRRGSFFLLFPFSCRLPSVARCWRPDRKTVTLWHAQVRPDFLCMLSDRKRLRCKIYGLLFQRHTSRASWPLFIFAFLKAKRSSRQICFMTSAAEGWSTGAAAEQGFFFKVSHVFFFGFFFLQKVSQRVIIRAIQTRRGGLRNR